MQLKKLNYEDVFLEFSSHRNQLREMFLNDKKRHKFLKTLEGIGLKSTSEDDTKRENVNVDTAMGTMLQ